MNEETGWLLDVYADSGTGVILWLLTDEGKRLQLRMSFSLTFYVTGDFGLLRQAWLYLRNKNVKLERTIRRDLFLGERDVMAVTIPCPSHIQRLFYDLSQQFPSLDYYDADIPLSLRFTAQTNTHLLGRCRVKLNDEWIQAIEPLDSPWEIDPMHIPLRFHDDIHPRI